MTKSMVINQKNLRSKTVRWYMGFKQRTGGRGYNPSRLVEVITNQVHRHNLSQYIPLLRIEKNPRGEYYFFLAIESEVQGEIPRPIVDSKFLDLPLFNSAATKKGNIFILEEIKQMVGVSHEVYDYTNPIPYCSQPRTTPESPLALAESTNIQDIDEKVIRKLSERHEYLLYWLSASGSGTWQSFKKICEVLELPEPKRILRRLKLLGHLTISENGSKWDVKPPSLLLLQSDLGTGDRTYLLHGQRSHPFLNKLQEFGKIRKELQPRGQSPYCIYLTVSGEITPQNFQEKLKTYGYSIILSNLPKIPSFHEWRNSLPRVQGVPTYKYKVKQFDGREFVDCAFQNQTGFYQFYTQEDQKPVCSFFYDESNDSWLQGDWYGLRFLAILSMGIQPAIYYNKAQKTLSILFSERLPEVYETCLVMQSGSLPTYAKGYLIYSHIPEEIARELSENLELEFFEE